MSDAATVIVGVTSVLSCVALLSWLGRPSEFRAVRVPKPPHTKPARSATEAVWLSPPPPEVKLAAPSEPALAVESPKRRRHVPARSFLVITKAPSRR